MLDKFDFYEEYGVEEYYVYSPEKNHLRVYLRQDRVLRRVRPVEGFVSPRLGISFDLSGPELVILRPDGQPFLTVEQLDAARRDAKQQADQAEKRADQAKQQADQAKKQADQAKQEADQAKQRAARAIQLGRKARQGQASPEEMAELEQLENETGDRSGEDPGRSLQ
jgi:hypothetical protein